MTDQTHSKLGHRVRAVMFRMPFMITCSELELRVDEYLDADLSRRERWMFEMHLKVCRDCRSYVEAYKRTVSVTASLFDVPYEQLGMGEMSATLVAEVVARHLGKDTAGR